MITQTDVAVDLHMGQLAALRSPCTECYVGFYRI